jgi:vancomycin resistance protein YoaR
MNRAIYTIIISLIVLAFYLTSFQEHCFGSSSNSIVIASFSTSIVDQDDNVKRNIIIACNKLNGMMLGPGTVFSFNNTVGEGSAKNGFAPGRVLYRDHVAIEPGGGLCQVSSTLFNALLMAGCGIVERHRHYQPVSYVPLGLDATIKYGKKDLKMKNPHQLNLRIEMKTSHSSIVAVISAPQKLQYRYEIETEEEEIDIPVGESPDRIQQGVSVIVYRKRYREKDCIDSQLLYRDYYPPVYVK